MDMPENNIIDDATAEVAKMLNAIELVVMTMNGDKQAALKKFTDADTDKGNDNAFAAACAFYSTCLVLETMTGKDIDIEQAYYACVQAGAIRKQDALIWSYEKIASTLGFAVKKFDALYIKGNEDLMVDLLRKKHPLVIFLGAPDQLNHVEPAHGFIRTPGETLVLLKDVGWQNDTHFSVGDRRTFHFEKDVRKYSMIDHGPLANTQRKAYKFGYYIV